MITARPTSTAPGDAHLVQLWREAESAAWAAWGGGVLALCASMAAFVLALGLAVGDEDLKLAGAGGLALVGVIAFAVYVRAGRARSRS